MRNSPPTAEELIERARKQREETPDVYLGGDPATEEQREAALQRVDERAQDEQTDLRIRQMEMRLQEQSELIKSLLEKDAARPMNELARAVGEQQAQRARQRQYAKIRKEYDGKVVLQIHTHEDLARNRPVDVYINGEHFSLPRGVPLTVPVSVLEVLDNARFQSSIKVVNAEGNPETMSFDQLSYPYNLLSLGGGH